MNITILTAIGLVFLIVVLDCATTCVLSWRLSLTMKAAFRLATLEDALAHQGKSDTFNTEQRSQFTREAFIGVLVDNGIAISVAGMGKWQEMCLSNGSGVTSNTRVCACYDSGS
ncbi:DDE-type integrase/transposase/recombinase [Bradyrhizobium sp. CCGB12]|nr:DDE-type integrase/transposase/recombinase [Bradyrhizobium sp. CCGB12]